MYIVAIKNDMSYKDYIPAGIILELAGDVIPLGYLACPKIQTDISRTTYPELFAAIGTLWGAGDGSTTFGMPYTGMFF